MARNEQPRENLLRDAVAYLDRAQFAVHWLPESLFVGRRPEGGWSFYFTQEQALQFNSAGELRRVYWHGLKLKAESGQLREVLPQRRRERLGDRLDHFLVDDGRQLRREMRDLCEQLRETLTAGDFQRVGEVCGSGTPLVSQLRQWLDERTWLPPPPSAKVPSPRVESDHLSIPIARSPHAT